MTNTPTLTPAFQTLHDPTGRPFFSANLPPLLHPPSPSTPNLATLLTPVIRVTRRHTSPFSTDLTPFDDILLSLLSLLLPLLLHALLASILLRAPDNRLPTLRFAIKQLIDTARNLHFRPLKRPPPRSRPPSPARAHALLAAAALLALTTASHFLLLYLSRPHHIPLPAARASLHLLPALTPAWPPVAAHVHTRLAPPCAPFALRGVHQRATRITACVTAHPPVSWPSRFDRLNNDTVNMTLTTDLHEFGARHRVQIAHDTPAVYTARGFFRLDEDEGAGMRLMRQRGEPFDRGEQVSLLHRQVVAFLLTLYARETADARVDLRFVNALDFEFGVQDGGAVDVMRVGAGGAGGRVRRDQAVRYVTRVRGRLPRGAAALRVVYVALKGGTGVGVADGGMGELGLASGERGMARGVVWTERVRTVNWLTMVVAGVVAVAVLVCVRVAGRPVRMASLAGIYFSSLIDDECMPMVLFGEEGQRGAHRGDQGGAVGAAEEGGRGEDVAKGAEVNEATGEPGGKSRVSKYRRFLAERGRTVQRKVAGAVGLKFKSHTSPDRDIVILL